MSLYLAVLWICIQYVLVQVRAEGLVEVFKWKQIDYYNRGSSQQLLEMNDTFVNEDTGDTSGHEPGVGNMPQSQANDLSDATYIAYNNVPIGATHYKGRLFITVPRRSMGIPSTLNYIDLSNIDDDISPKLKAYPDFDRNQFRADVKNLVSVYRTSTDACGRLWFVDTGILEYPNNHMQIQRPSIWVIDLETDRVVRRYEILESIVSQGHGLASLTVDTDKGCDKAYAYIPDLAYYQLYVYSFEDDHLWKFQHEYFDYDPLAGNFNIAGLSFSWDDGIFSMTLGPKTVDGSRNVLFHAMASYNEYAVSNEILQTESNALRSDHGQDFRLMGSRGTDRQSSMHSYDPRTGVVFFAEVQRNAVGCWNSRKPFGPENLGTISQDALQMIYPSDLTIDDDGILWVMTNSMPIFIYSTLDADVYNFRVWKQNTTIAVSGTECA